MTHKITYSRLRLHNKYGLSLMAYATQAGIIFTDGLIYVFCIIHKSTVFTNLVRCKHDGLSYQGYKRNILNICKYNICITTGNNVPAHALATK